jgi:hypothetical protein
MTAEEILRGYGPSRLSEQDVARLKSEAVFCGYCGTRMQEILHPHPSFDRKTGQQGAKGLIYWECPRRGVGLAAMHGEWTNTHDDNPHDSRELREA